VGEKWVTGVNCWVRVAPSKVPSFGSARCVSPRPALSLLRSRPLSTLCLATPVARHGFRAPSSSLQARQSLTDGACGSVDPSCGTSRSSRCRRPPPAEAGCGGAHRVTSSPGFDHLCPPRNAAYDSHAALELHGAFRSLPPLRRIEHAESTTARGLSTAVGAGFASPDFVPSPGFRTLLTACSSARLPGLFHPGSALGVRSSELSSRPASRGASRRPLPS
jgi:hypothetical protein